MKIKRFIVLLLVISTLLSISTVAYASKPDIDLQYIGTSVITATLTISDSGKASCGSSVSVYDGYTADVTMELIQVGGSTVKKWSDSGSYTVKLDKVWYVSSGYYYYVHVSADIYDSDGNYVENVTNNSYLCYY